MSNGQRTIATRLGVIVAVLVIATLAGCGYSPDKGWHWSEYALLKGLHESNSDPVNPEIERESRSLSDR